MISRGITHNKPDPKTKHSSQHANLHRTIHTHASSHHIEKQKKKSPSILVDSAPRLYITSSHAFLLHQCHCECDPAICLID